MNENVPNDNADDFSGVLTVSRLTALIKNLFERLVPPVSVSGELSNYVLHSSGHRYFTLKDEQSQIRCVMFRWQAGKLDFEPSDGMMVRAYGTVTVYERGGQYQLNVLRLMPMGRGELFERFEELKKKLAAEGVFANERPIPSYPETVAVITSPTGAAVRDIISIIRRRAPHVRIVIRETLVQGAEAAQDIVRALREVNTHLDADVIIIGRGGGSIEDLWCFNEEIVARAIASSIIPVISAVGHETDVTLADFAADLRAPTPSAAAELVVRDSEEIRQQLLRYRLFLRQRVMSFLDEYDRTIGYLAKNLSLEHFIQMVSAKNQVVDELSFRLKNAAFMTLSEREKTLEGLGSKLAALNPEAVLDRGYSIVYRNRDSMIVSRSSMVEFGEGITVRLAEGSLGAAVVSKDS